MRNPIRLLIEKVRNAANEVRTVDVWDERWGIPPYPDFVYLKSLYTKDPHVFSQINGLTLLIVSSKFHITGEDEEAVRIVEEWNRATRFHQVIATAVNELLWAGNSFWLRVKDEKHGIRLQHIPLTTVKRIVPDAFGNPKQLVVEVMAREVAVGFENVVHFYIFRIDNELFGTGILRALAEPRELRRGERKVEVASPIEIKWMMEEALWRMFMRYNANFLIALENATQSEYNNFTQALEELRPGEALVTTRPIRVESLFTDTRLRVGEFVDYVNTMMAQAGLTVFPRLFTHPGYTEASARVAQEIQEQFVAAVKERVKETIEEEVYGPLLELRGKPGAHVSFNWGLPSTREIPDVETILKAAYPPNGLVTPVITREEARKMLLQLGWIIEETPVDAPEGSSPETAQERVTEALYPRWVDTLSHVILQFVDPESVDKATIRYVTIDSERDIVLAVADVQGDEHGILRRPVELRFGKARGGWTLDRAKYYYTHVFPALIYELLSRRSA